MITYVQQHAGALGAWWYPLLGLLVFAEDALFFGFVIPGETAAIAGGMLAALGVLDYPVVLAVVLVAAVVGDQVGYQVGRAGGPRLRASRVGRRIGEGRWRMAEAFFERHGGPSVFLGRWVSFLRAMVPATAGMSRMPYRVFLPWNAVGGVAWSVAAVTLGYLLGHSIHTLEHWLGIGNLAFAGVVAVFAAVVWWRHRREREVERDLEAET